jgi:hypothetical protein
MAPKKVRHWRCSKVYIDESWIEIQSVEYLIVGALFAPPGEGIESKLEALRQAIQCVDTMHSSQLKGAKQLELAHSFVAAFRDSKCKFRSLIIPKTREKYKTYFNGEKWRMEVHAIKLVLSHCYLSNSETIKLIRPKLLIERSSSYGKNFPLLEREISATLILNANYSDSALFKAEPAPIVTLVDKRVMESLQLTDLLVALVKWDLVGPKSDKLKYFNQSLSLLLPQTGKRRTNSMFGDTLIVVW